MSIVEMDQEAIRVAAAATIGQGAAVVRNRQFNPAKGECIGAAGVHAMPVGRTLLP